MRACMCVCSFDYTMDTYFIRSTNSHACSTEYNHHFLFFGKNDACMRFKNERTQTLCISCAHREPSYTLNTPWKLLCNFLIYQKRIILHNVNDDDDGDNATNYMCLECLECGRSNRRENERNIHSMYSISYSIYLDLLLHCNSKVLIY